MATLDDILTAQKNGVVAINTISQYLKTANELTVYLNGSTTSDGLAASGLVVAGKSGRLVSLSVLEPGTTVGKVYDYLTFPTTAASGSGAAATITYSGSMAVVIGDTVVVAGVAPSGYNTPSSGSVVTGVASQQVQYANTATGSQTTPGTVFNANTANSIAAIPNTVGVFHIGAQFTSGLYVILGTNQKVAVTYSLD